VFCSCLVLSNVGEGGAQWDQGTMVKVDLCKKLETLKLNASSPVSCGTNVNFALLGRQVCELSGKCVFLHMKVVLKSAFRFEF